MRMPLTKYGRPQVLTIPAALLVVMALLFGAGSFYLPGRLVVVFELILAALTVWVISFFRDPRRQAPNDSVLLLAPADGRITDIEIVEENEFIGGPVVRIGIFLNIFNVHINRAPCNVRVEKITHKKGKYKNAMNPYSGRVNESNDLWLVRTDSPLDRLIVRQISGAIARRIVCEAVPGQNLAGGEKFGMIKFGSRTELYVPTGEDGDSAAGGKNAAKQKPKLLVKTGDKVKAGLTGLVRYE